MNQSQFSNNSIDTVVTSITEVVNDAARKCFATKNYKKNKIIMEIIDIKDGLINRGEKPAIGQFFAGKPPMINQ